MGAPQVDVQALAALLGLTVPILVAFIVKATASNGLKIFVNLFFTAVMAVIALWANANGHISFWQAVNTVLVTLTTALASYRGIWKPLNLEQKTGPTVGLGGGPKAP